MKNEIIKFIKNYFDVYFNERNYPKLLHFFSSEITVIGTGKHEIGKTFDQTLTLYQKDINEVKDPIEYYDLDIVINVQTEHFSIASGDFAIRGKADGVEFIINPLRFSLTIRKEKGEWKILHLHISTPNDMQEENELYPLQKLIKQNQFLNREVEKRTKELVHTNEKLSSSNKTKEHLLSLIAHDIRSPFNGLLGFIDILKSEFDSLGVEKQKKIIGHISATSNKIYNLADNLLIWAKLQQNGFECNMQPIHLHRIAQKSAEPFHEIIENKMIQFENSIDQSVIVLSDEFMLETIFRNLISNALKYSFKNGKVIISTRLSGLKNKNEITVCVEDFGTGMCKEKLDNLFLQDVNVSKPGTMEEKGTGIGPSLCFQFIKLLQTKLWAESKLNKGSSFCFNLNSV